MLEIAALERDPYSPLLALLPPPLLPDASSGDEASRPSGSATTAAASKPAPAFAGATGRRRFDDEDVEEDVKDDWGASSEEDEAPKAKGTGAALPKKKLTFKQKIAEKEAEERRRMELGLAHGQDKDDVDVLEYDPIAARRAEKAAQIRADVGNAADLLGTTGISDGEDDDFSEIPKDKSVGKGASNSRAGAAAASSSSSSLPAWATQPTPKTKTEWEQLSQSLYSSVLKTHAAKDPGGFGKHLVPHLTKLLTNEMRDVDTRKLSVTVKGWADEKTAAEQAARRAGGNANANRGGAAGAAKPKSVGTSSAKNTTDLNKYGEEALDDADAYDEDLDFM